MNTHQASEPRKNPAEIIRAELKARHGWTSKHVSVRTSDGTGSVRIAIKAPGVSGKLVKEIAQQHERVRRCESSGEILCGGNVFVFVGYDDSALAPAIAEIMPVLTAALTTDGAWINVGDGMYQVTRENEHSFRAYHSSSCCMIQHRPSWDLADVAECIARHMVENG